MPEGRREKAIEGARAALGADNPLREVLYLLVEENRQFFFYVHDREGIFTYLSPSVQTITGRTPAEWMRHYTTYLTDNPINVGVALNTETTLSTGDGSASYLVEVVHADGRPIMLEVFEQPLLRGGKIEGICGLAHDVTERVRAEAERDRLGTQLERSRRLEALGLLAGTVAHDFNNTLTVIQLAAQSALRQVDGRPELDRLRGPLAEIMETIRQSGTLTQQLLAIGRQQPVSPVRIDLGEFLRREAPVLRHLAGDRIDIELALADGLPAIEIDESQLVQILFNLVSNARDAMPAGGTIRLETAAGDPDAVRLRVIDDGQGMDAETCERIFEPYFTTKRERGSGLGLASVYGAVTQCGGTIRVTSQPGAGTTFELSLVAAAPRA